MLKTSCVSPFSWKQKAAYLRNMNNVGSRNLFQQVLSVLLKHFDLERQAAGINESGALGLLSEKNPQLVDLLYELRNSENAFLFVKADRELRQKVPDIWQLQCKQSEQALNDVLTKLQVIGGSLDLQFPQKTG